MKTILPLNLSRFACVARRRLLKELAATKGIEMPDVCEIVNRKNLTRREILEEISPRQLNPSLN